MIEVPGTLDFVVAAIPLHALPKCLHRQMIHDLLEDCLHTLLAVGHVGFERQEFKSVTGNMATDANIVRMLYQFRC